jgi:hypothetical protein
MPPTRYPDSVRVEPAQQERRGLLVPIVGILLVAVLGLQLWQLLGGPIWHGGSDALKCAPDSSDCFDSGWQPVSNSTSAAFIYRASAGRHTSRYYGLVLSNCRWRPCFSPGVEFPSPGSWQSSHDRGAA